MTGSAPTTDAARAAAALAAREAYGHLTARLAARSGDVAAAEDALGEALVKALEVWPETGVPDAPVAWLTTVARRQLMDRYRRTQTASAAEPALKLLSEETMLTDAPATPLSDDRLRLMFVCAHPAIDESVRAPLMLQTLLGLTAAEIAAAFLVPPATMSQRLVRAKAKVKQARIPFELAEARTLTERLPSVLDAIYAAFTVADGADAAGCEDAARATLSQEAIWLASLAAALLPEAGETHGLLSLMLFSAAREPAGGDLFVPLSRQDPGNWDADRITDAEAALRTAARLATPGRYQIEAAIQSVHMDRRRTGRTDWDAIDRLYEALSAVAPSLGATVAHAAALYEAHDVTRAAALLASLPADAVADYQPYWAVRAHLELATGRDASEALARAIALTRRHDHRTYLEGLADRDLN
ncbi:MAG: DUF6596 domain-containing protein [Pseudomonadota bacterium]